MKNPFITSGYAGAAYFCDRVQETAQLTKLLINGNNVVLMSPRRIGKTGLLYHCFAQEEIKNVYNTFIIDIYSTKNLNELVMEIGKVVLGSLKSKGRKAIEKFLDIVSSLKPGITFDVAGNATWNLEAGSLHSAEFTLDQIFEYLQTSDRPCIVAIDEFQQITHYPEKTVEATLRTYIQKCQNATFVFSGSERHLLSEMFHNPARPFYASTSTLPLEPIPLEKYDEFAKVLFEQADRHLEDGVVELVYNKFDGVTWFVQKVMNQLFSNLDKGETCTLDMVEPSIRQIVKDNSVVYADLLYQLSIRQKELLLAICREGKARAITGGKFIKKYHLPTPSTIQASIKSLTDNQIVTYSQDTYEVYDKFFALWLKEN